MAPSDAATDRADGESLSRRLAGKVHFSNLMTQWICPTLAGAPTEEVPDVSREANEAVRDAEVEELRSRTPENSGFMRRPIDAIERVCVRAGIA